MTAAALIALAERMEAATAYDGRLCAEIDCAARYRGSNVRPAEPDDHPSVKDRAFDPSSIWTPTGWLMSHNFYGCMDDATLIVPAPGKWSITAGHMDDWQACIWTKDHVPLDWRSAATPAAALTSAALRALAASLA